MKYSILLLLLLGGCRKQAHINCPGFYEGLGTYYNVYVGGTSFIDDEGNRRTYSMSVKCQVIRK